MASGGIRNFKQSMKELEAMRGKSETVIKRLVSDARTRVPGWVATEVVKVYNIRKAEVMPNKEGKKIKAAGSIRVKGDTIDELEIVYKGRLLTPVHFGMTPKAPKESYTLTMQVLKGKKTVLGKKKKLTKAQRKNIGKNFRRQGTQSSSHSPIMLMPTGAKMEEVETGGVDAGQKKVQNIPFQRKSTNRNDVEVIKVISMPQMVSSPRTRDNIMQAINDGLSKRMAQHMKLLAK